MNKPSSARGTTVDRDAPRHAQTAVDPAAQTFEAATPRASVRRGVPSRNQLVLWASLGLRGLLVAAALGLSLWHLGTYLVIVRERLFYPYALEWMEGGTLEHVARVVEGKPLYVRPSLEFTPFIYTPLYYWVSVPFVKLFGLGLPSLRVVSFAASLGIFALLFAFVWTHTRNWVASVTAVGMFAAGFEVCGGYYDLARVDSLALFWLLLGIWLLRRHDAWAGVCLAAAFLTKQSTALVTLPVLAVHVATQVNTRRFWAAGLFGAVTLAVSVLMDRLSGGEYRYYVFTLPSQHPWYTVMRRDFWRSDMFEHVPFACAAVLYLLSERRRVQVRLQLWAATLGFIASAWLLRLHAGGWINVLMPVIAFLAWALGETVHRAGPRPALHAGPGWPLLAHPRSVFGLALCVAQLYWLLYTPESHVPSAEDRARSAALVAYLRTIDGPVLALFDPALARNAGKVGSAHQQAITDIGLGADKARDDALQADILRALEQRRYAAIVTSGGAWHAQELSVGYQKGPSQLTTGTTKEGAPCQAAEIWLRRRRK